MRRQLSVLRLDRQICHMCRRDGKPPHSRRARARDRRASDLRASFGRRFTRVRRCWMRLRPRWGGNCAFDSRHFPPV